MPLRSWTVDPVSVVIPFGTRRSCEEAGALLAFAVWTAESIPHLRDVDRQDDLSQPTINGHAPHVVDVAHARWATGSCATALDLCAAALGRALCGHTGTHELDLAAFDPNGKRKGTPTLRAALPSPALAWVDAVFADADYAELRGLRNRLTHGRVARHFAMPRRRLLLDGASARLDVPAWIELAERLAFKQIGDLVAILPAL